MQLVSKLVHASCQRHYGKPDAVCACRSHSAGQFLGSTPAHHIPLDLRRRSVFKSLKQTPSIPKLGDNPWSLASSAARSAIVLVLHFRPGCRLVQSWFRRAGCNNKWYIEFTFPLAWSLDSHNKVHCTKVAISASFQVFCQKPTRPLERGFSFFGGPRCGRETQK